MPKAFSEHEKETIRAQMREKGKRLFEKHGLKKTSLDDLTQAVGISKGAFYLFYNSKEELFLEILEEFETEIQTSILDFALRPKVGAHQNVKDMLKSFLLTWDTYPLLKNFGQAEYEYLLRKVPPERIHQHAQRDTDFSNHFIRKVKREGITVKASPRAVSNLIKSLFFIGLHRDDLGETGYEETMSIMIDLVAGYVTGNKE